MGEMNHDSLAKSDFFLDPKMKHASKLTAKINRESTRYEMTSTSNSPITQNSKSKVLIALLL